MNQDSPPILYSFRRCPYAIRARMAIHYSGLSVELREVILRNKPQEMLNISPKGTVPVLVLATGEVIDESWDVMKVALAYHDPEGWLAGLDQATLQQGENLIQKNDGPFKQFLDRYKYPNRFPEDTIEDYRTHGEEFLQKLDELLEHQAYLIGQHLSFVDIAIFPFIRQFAFVDKTWFDQTPYPNLHRWLESLLSSPLFLNVMKKYKPWEPGMEPVIFPELPT